MRRYCVGWLVSILLCALSAGVTAQVQPPSTKLLIVAKNAYTWSSGSTDIIQLEGPVNIRLDAQELTADSAVVWLSPEGITPGREAVQVALIGNASVNQPIEGITRSGTQLLVTASVKGDIRVTAEERLALDQSKSPLFLQADQLRAPVSLPSTQQETPVTENGEGVRVPAPARPAEPGSADAVILPAAPTQAGPAANPEDDPDLNRRNALITHAVRSASTQPTGMHIRASADTIESVPTSDNTQAFAMTGDVLLIQSGALGRKDKPGEKASNDYIELHAQRAVVFTDLRAHSALNTAALADFKDHIIAAYLEGAVHVDYVAEDPLKPEQRLTANRVYFDFRTHEAILTDAILRSSEPSSHVPVVIRAQKLRQLADREYAGENVEMSTSSFATPTYSVKTDRLYVDEEPSLHFNGQEEVPQTDTNFVGDAATLRFWGLPILYWPQITGTINDDPFPLRTIDIGNSNRFGFYTLGEFGVFESLGRPHPKNLDVSVVTDYFSQRGPAFGLNGKYYGSNIDNDTKSLSDFDGDVRSLIITDHGTDKFGGARSDVTPPDQIRGKFLVEHEQFLPDHWEAQLRFGYVSDPTFLEEYYPREFYEDLNYDAEAYFKRQVDTEALTFLVNFDTNRFPTTTDQQQEQFDVEHFPELRYQRIGDSSPDDTLTFFSDTSVDRLRFARSHFSLAHQGFVFVGPGIPSQGYTGTQTSAVYRGDTREEVDLPVQIGQIKAVPYVMGRLDGYTDSPTHDAQGRVYSAVGVRMTTAFWKVDDSVQNDLLDLHRMRHVIEPEVNLYVSGATINRDRLFIYDENVDGINDVGAAEFALHQRWQTYRGAPGREVSDDVVSLNVSADIFTHPPKDGGIVPEKFRGLYFPSDPEASIPRDAINSDLTWKISQTTAFLADMQYNTDHAELATGSVGIIAKHGDRLSYYAGLRYIEQLNSDIATLAAEYQLSTKYTLQISQSYDFGSSKNVDTTLMVQRYFDTLVSEFGIYHDAATGESGVRFNVYPIGFGKDRGIGAVNGLFNGSR